MQPTTLTFLTHLSRSPEATLAAIADNGRFDERESSERWQGLEDILHGNVASPSAIGPKDWSEADRLHYERTCAVPSLSVPDAFLPINRGAWLEPAGNQDLVRFEILIRPLKSAGLIPDELTAILDRADGSNADARKAVDEFFAGWNLRRDGRPTFAAFYDEVQTEADADDWPHALRDRLGLGHYARPSPRGTDPIPVALMRYSLAEVLAARSSRSLASACALPTVLDGGMHEFFFPTPREHPFGATLHLDGTQAGLLTAEILHCRIDYRREHLWKLGTIERPHRLRDDLLRESRDLHLLAIQDACGRDDFGEPIVGRI
jgi:hypothetical protein